MTVQIPEVAWRGGLTVSKYSSIHSYIRSRFGKADYCSNPYCSYDNPKIFEWALIKGREYSKNIEDYIQLCPSCHRKYDETEQRKRKISTALKKITRGNNSAARLVLNTQTGIFYDCIIDAAESIGMNPHLLRCRLSGWTKNKTDFIYA